MRKILSFLSLLVTIIAVAACGGSSKPANPVHQSFKFQRQVRHPHFPPGAYQHALGGSQVLPGYDDVTLSSIPVGSSFTGGIGCYGFGSFTNCGEASSRFPHAHLVSITPSEIGNAKILDVEPGDATPSQAHAWISKELNAGHFRPGIYASQAWMDQVRSNLSGFQHCSPSSTTAKCYVLWVAAWDNNSGIPAGYDAHQWFGGNVIDKDTFGSWIFKAAAPPPPPNAPGCSAPSTHTSFCYGRFPTVLVKNKVRGGACYFGCREQNTVKNFDYDIRHAKAKAARLQRDTAQLWYLTNRLVGLEHTRSVKVNGDTYTYGRVREDRGRARHFIRNSWANYL